MYGLMSRNAFRGEYPRLGYRAAQSGHLTSADSSSFRQTERPQLSSSSGLQYEPTRRDAQKPSSSGLHPSWRYLVSEVGPLELAVLGGLEFFLDDEPDELEPLKAGVGAGALVVALPCWRSRRCRCP